MKKNLRVAMIAGEASGDTLGAGLINAMHQIHPAIEFEGIGGPLMIKNGFRSHYPMEKLSVMGLFEVVKHLPEILSIRKKIIHYLLANPPDVFIGIDSPDFCLPVERRLKDKGIKTVHYVSPTIWGWREKRIIKIKRAADLVLCLFPFEPDYYTRYQAEAEFIGHTLADQLPLDCNLTEARKAMNLPIEATLVAILPGSRRSEVERLGHVFFQAARQLAKNHSHVQFLVPCASAGLRDLIEQQLQEFSDLEIKLYDGQSRAVMAASDMVVMASGTATLEAMLLKKPMVVGYKLSYLTWNVVRRMVKTKWASLPNILAQETLVPEFLQDDATPNNIAQALLTYLKHPETFEPLKESFDTIHRQLQKNADLTAARAIFQKIGNNC
jgi:lipid-A-disaccharide synthase